MPDGNDNHTPIIDHDKWRKWLDNDPPTHDKQYPTDIILDQLAEFHDKLHELDGAAGVHHHHGRDNDIIVCTRNCGKHDDLVVIVNYIPGADEYDYDQYGPRDHDHDTRGSD